MTTDRRICSNCLDFHDRNDNACGDCSRRRAGLGSQGIEAARKRFRFFWLNPTPSHYAFFLGKARAHYASRRFEAAERTERWLAYAERVLGIAPTRPMAHA